MHVYIYICTYVCMYVCMYVYYTYVIRTDTHVCIHVHVCMYYVCMYVRMCVFIFTCCVNLQTRSEQVAGRSHMHNMCVRARECVCVCVRAFVCVCVCVAG